MADENMHAVVVKRAGGLRSFVTSSVFDSAGFLTLIHVAFLAKESLLPGLYACPGGR